ncbi:PocR ligand-binding domain-containing protein [Dehalobacterium formicoaceticum]|uniref:PocR ligand-binding domain-containing protein n=1 Tax=Dehalobacterium formicoaceticum TaxID=51515 RepID=UPI0031F69B14
MLGLTISEQVNDVNMDTLADSNLQYLLNSFAVATDLPVSATDINGNCILSAQGTEQNFCTFIKGSCESKRCQETYKEAGKQAAKWREPYIFQCHAGLTIWVCPVYDKNQHIANLTGGRVLMWQQDDYFYQEINSLASKLQLNPETLLSKVQELKIATPSQVQSAANLLSVTATYLSRGGSQLMNEQRKLRQVSSWLWNKNHRQKDLSFQEQDASRHSMLELEGKLIQDIRSGDSANARKNLEQLVFKAFLLSKGHLETLKGLCMGFTSQLIRLSTENEPICDNSNKIAFPKLGELEDADTPEKVMLWLLNTGNSYIEQFSAQNPAGIGNEIIQKAIAYIQKNFSLPELCLTEIAQACFVSSSYLSRLFKKEKGYSIIEHINRVRIRQAKLLLQTPEATIMEVAHQVGYNDRSYFNRVFKQITGVNPRDYRHQFELVV